MRLFTAHVHPKKPPRLVREGWSWGAFIFGPFWLLARGAWIAALLWAVVSVAPAFLAPAPRVVASLAVSVLAGLIGRDLVRWSLERRGYVLAHVVAAPDAESALARFLSVRGDQVARLLPRPGSGGRWAWLP